MNYKKNLARLMTAAMMMSTIVSFIPATQAADVIDLSDTLTRIEQSVSAVHSIEFTLPSTAWSTGDIVITYNAGFSFTGPASAGGCTYTATPTANVITLSSPSGCSASATLTIDGLSSTNPTAGSYPYVVSGSAGFTGQGSVVIVADDTITVNATVDPTITFMAIALPAASTCSSAYNIEEYTPDYVVDMGSLNLASLTISKSLNADSNYVDQICTQGSSNATGGMAVTVKNANGASGLVSSSVTGDTIPSSVASNTVVAGTPGYGICLVESGLSHDTGLTPAGVAPTATGEYGTYDCGVALGTVVELSTTATEMWSTAGPSQDATGEVNVRVAISATQPAHNDYTDALTFVATGTF